jgi:hypothetical protein
LAHLSTLLRTIDFHRVLGKVESLRRAMLQSPAIMKKPLPVLYYVIPAVYVLVIGFFVLMQFRARESFQENLGALGLRGSYSKSLGGARQIRDLTVSCNGVRLRFPGGRLLLRDPGPARSRRLRVLSYNRSGQSVELSCSEDLRLSFSLAEGGTVELRPLIPAALQGLHVLSLALDLGEERAERVRGIPLLRLSGRSGLRYVALPAGSDFDLRAGRLEVNLQAEGAPVAFERADPARDEPYVYWFSRRGPLADEARYLAGLERFLDDAYGYWNQVIMGTPGDPAIAEDLGACLLSEAARRGDYRRFLPAVAAAVRARAESGPSIRTAAYVGYLQGFQAASAQQAAALIDQVTEAVRRSDPDPAVLDTPGLLRVIVNRGPFSLAEEVLRLADAADRSGAPVSRLVSLLEIYTEAADLLGQPFAQKASDLIDASLLPAVLQTREGLFLARASGEQEGRVEVLDSVRAGRLFLRAAGLTARPSLALVGRGLLLAAMSLADSEGFVPARGSVLSGGFRALEGQLPPEKLYGYLAEARYLPEEYSLYRQLSPGAWLYTAALPVQIKAGSGQYRFSLGFPVGGSHYFLLQGIPAMQSVMLHEILWKSDPEYSRYSDGWVYDPATQTLFGKLSQRLPEEDLVINF